MFLGKKGTIGIVSGAGPMAGISLLTQIIKGYQEKGAWRDRDFPEIRLINFPFSEMLEPGFNQEIVRQELQQVLQELELNSEYFVIACNTLHLFLPNPNIRGFINLIDLIHSKIPEDIIPLVFSSRTSANLSLHERLLGRKCVYWNPEESQSLIDKILANKPVDLSFIFELSKTHTIILGCTEYSLFFQDEILPDSMIDPLKLAAAFLIQKTSALIDNTNTTLKTIAHNKMIYF